MYFSKTGKDNTKETVELAINKARENGINHIVVASSSGYTMDFFKDVKDINIICVSHCYGYPKAGENDMSIEKREELEKSGIKVLTTTHVLSGAERGISKKFGGAYPVEIIAGALRLFGQGTKVCVEIAVMAVDSGLIPYMEPVIAIGGTGHGADTSIIIRTSHASNILDSKIDEIICKPHLV